MAHGFPQPSAPKFEVIVPLVSLVLYVCSQASEIGEPGRQPHRPEAKRTKRGLQHFPADKPTTWDVGVRLGAALRRAYQTEQSTLMAVICLP
jgi:hypothetical protein